jgi:hypothetical protein
VEAALVQARDFNEKMGQVVTDARERLEFLKHTVDVWTLRLALGTTALCAVGALGQLFMARACWRGLRK